MSDSSSSVKVDCIKKNQKKKRAYDYNADFDSLTVSGSNTVPDMLSFSF